jgi:CBS-domain-containing membrane protein
MNFLEKLKGDGQKLPASYGTKSILLAGLGGFFAISVVGFLAVTLEQALILGSFGASCVLLFGFPDVPFSQPRNAIVGHFLSSLIGLLFYHFVSTEWWSMALAVGIAIMAMMYTRTVHPPAGSNPVIIFLLKSSWSFLIFPTLTGSVLVVLVALIFNNVTRSSKYPKYW